MHSSRARLPSELHVTTGLLFLKPQESTLFEVLNRLIELRDALGNIRNTRAQFGDLLCRRALGKLWIGQLCLKLRRFRLRVSPFPCRVAGAPVQNRSNLRAE